jgi:hypothetical protein
LLDYYAQNTLKYPHIQPEQVRIVILIDDLDATCRRW